MLQLSVWTTSKGQSRNLNRAQRRSLTAATRLLRDVASERFDDLPRAVAEQLEEVDDGEGARLERVAVAVLRGACRRGAYERLQARAHGSQPHKRA
jgi:hypothetical protein